MSIETMVDRRFLGSKWSLLGLVLAASLSVAACGEHQYDLYCGALLDGNGDRNFDSSWTFERDEKGREVLIEGDAAMDGTVERRTYLVYNDHGLELERTVDGEENPVSSTTVTYDDRGNGVERLYEHVSGQSSRTRYRYDDRHRVTRREEDSDNNGYLERAWVFTYDGNDERPAEFVLLDANDELEWRATYTYNDCGDPDLLGFDFGGDGSAEWFREWTYVACERPASEILRSISGDLADSKSWRYNDDLDVVEERQAEEGRTWIAEYQYDCAR